MSQNIINQQGCIFDCRPAYYSPITGYTMHCRVVCPQPTIVFLPDPPAPTPLPCDDAAVTMTRISMSPPDSSGSSQLWPNRGRWGNDFDFEGRAFRVHGNPFTVTLNIQQNGRSSRKTSSNPDFAFNLTTYGIGASSRQDGYINWELKLDLICQGETYFINGPNGSIEMKSVDWNYEKTLRSSENLVELTTEHTRKDGCYEQRLSFSESRQASWSFAFGASGSGLLANFGLSASYTQTFQSLFILPFANSASLLIETHRDTYDARRYKVDWMGIEENSENLGPLYNTYTKPRVRINGPCFN